MLAHSDDESLGVGGRLAKYAAEGVETFLVTATRGQSGRYDFNGDGVADLAIGVPDRDFPMTNEGVVHIVYGAAQAGLQATGVGGPASQLWSEASPGGAGVPEQDDQFGFALASK